MRVVRYESAYKAVWDEFVSLSKNGHFMFQRAYMDYHADRFEDQSVLFFHGEKLLAIMPANIRNDTLESHGGLTFGGVISNTKMTIGSMLEIFNHLIEYCRAQGIGRVNYKAIPHIYHLAPSEEDIYAMFRNGASLYRRDPSFGIYGGQGLRVSKGKKHSVKKAGKHGVSVSQSLRFAQFWQLLAETLRVHHAIAPVHNLDEISSLAEAFPEHIKLYEARSKNNDLLAGAVLYKQGLVTHTQYLANSDIGRDIGALDALLFELASALPERGVLSFGISSEDAGRTLNAGLARYKEGFGARTFVNDFYVLEI